MPKLVGFSLDQTQCDWIFRPIRSKRDSLLLLMRSLKFAMIARYIDPPQDPRGRITFYVDKMNRIFYTSERKVFSIACPFFITESDSGLVFRDSFYPEIDSKVTSDVISVLEHDPALSHPEFHFFVDHVFPYSEYDSNFWQMLRRLMLSEDGYIRYDQDPSNENGSRHPLHHLDIFYGSHASFKLGLMNGLDEAQLRDVLDLNTDCYYATVRG
ncbi:Conserved hypothetical protein [Xanthomonas translucens pv. translucens DSM 18974]|uniref:Uncharacterized protein n=2 Tax=Xanthomonas campestris pv. translucens TaxID=343 RepID=A0A1C3TTD4_XANCT|nr:hypothetical protein BN444_01308 [Xanthomonas translucens pv. translucens DSM 18974]SCB06405.1 Conserved hypothetical protein [Xanthomonas translucens pv. translucens DSM 18974]